MYCNNFGCKLTNVCRCTVQMDSVTYTHSEVSSVPKNVPMTIIDLIQKMMETDYSAVNWDYVSKMKLERHEYEMFKKHLNWEIVSKKIGMDVVEDFSEFVDWELFEEANVRRAVKETRKKVYELKESIGVVERN